jgi:hypothetical protein
MKTCPNCGADVPESAVRCKSCFHDLNDEVPTTRKLGPIVLLASFAGMAVVAAIGLAVILSYPTDQKILVDEATRSIVTVTQYRTSRETERVKWDDVERIEYVSRLNEFEVRAVTQDGQPHTIEKGTAPLEGAAMHYSELMGKPLKPVDELGASKLE